MASPFALSAVALSVLVVLVLARAAWHKWAAFLEVVGFAQGYGIVPDRWAPAAVRTLGAAEAAAVLAILLPAARPAGGLAAAALFLGYGALMAWALLQGRDQIDCGCGGAPQVVSGWTLLRNGLLAAAALAVAAAPVQPAGPAGAAMGILAGLLLAAIYTIAEKLISHMHYIRRRA